MAARVHQSVERQPAETPIVPTMIFCCFCFYNCPPGSLLVPHLLQDCDGTVAYNVHAGCPTIGPCWDELKRATIEGRTVVAATYLLYSLQVHKYKCTNTNTKIQNLRQNTCEAQTRGCRVITANFIPSKDNVLFPGVLTDLYLATSSVGWFSFLPQKIMALTKMRVVMAVLRSFRVLPLCL